MYLQCIVYVLCIVFITDAFVIGYCTNKLFVLTSQLKVAFSVYICWPNVKPKQVTVVLL